MDLNFGFSGTNSATTSGFDLGNYEMGALSSSPSYGGGATRSVSTGSVQPVAQTVGTQPVQQNQPGGTNWFGEHGKMNTIIGGVQVLGSLWNSYQQHKMAKEQMAFAREQWDTNLANQTQTYNTALEDRIRARHFTEGKDATQTDAYLEKHSL